MRYRRPGLRIFGLLVVGACQAPVGGTGKDGAPPESGDRDAAVAGRDRAPLATIEDAPRADTARPDTATPDVGTPDQPRADTAPPQPPANDGELYDPERVPRFDIMVPPDSIAALRAHEGTPLEGEYVRASFRYGDETLADIGLRIKGESNRSPFEKKPAWKLKFDAFVPKQSFRGLRRMTFNNLGEDPSAIAERVSYDLFRLAKLPAPRANSAVVYVNGQSYGIYANIETEDKAFLRRWFASDAGNLYEEGQQDFLPGKEGTFELETNEEKNDRSDLRGLIAAFAGARDATYLDDLDKALDTTHFLRFTAVEGIVNQWDMYGYTRFYPNNFRIYNDPTSAKFVFLPWGIDMAWKPYHDGSPHLGMLAVAHGDNNARLPITAGAMFVRCLGIPACKTRYVGVIRELLQVFEMAGLDRVAERYYAQVKPLVYADTHKSFSNQDFERSYMTVLRTIRDRPARIRADIGN